VTGRYRRRLFKKAASALLDGEKPLAAVRAVVPPWWASSQYGQSGRTVKQVSEDTGFPLGQDNALVLTDRRLLNFSTGFFGRIETLRGAVALAEFRGVRQSGKVVTGRAMTFDMRHGKPLTLAVRWQDDLARFVSAMGEALAS
jgi:hypothetical protein